MKIWVLSDLHLEVEGLGAPLEPPADADLCVMAGDLVNSCERGVRWLAENVPFDSVYVPGNHEFYRNSVVEGLAAGRAAAVSLPQVTFMEDDVAVIRGTRFIGAALWTDFSLMGHPALAMSHARQCMNDYRAISWKKDPWERFTPEKSLQAHFNSRTFIQSALKIPFDGPTVVVTHHCPHPGSVHERFRGDLLNAAFCSDLADMIEMDGPDLWVHGHTHHSFDYEVGDTRIVCNPRGYGRENPEFSRGLVVDVDLLPKAAARRNGP